MPARRQITALLVLVAWLLGAGCGGSDGPALSPETDDALYQQGKQLQKLGRNAEALTAFLKVAEKRGEQPSPESHLEAGLIYLQHIKDPIEAIHHFRKYLELEPNSKQAPLVRQRIDLARRELFRTMPGRPSEDPRSRLGSQEIIDRLQREIDELKSDPDRSRGNGAAPLLRTTRGPVDAVGLTKNPQPTFEDQLRLAPPPPSMAVESPAPLVGARGGPATKAASSPSKPVASGTVAGKRHSVSAGDTLYRVSLKYGVTVEAILAVNRDVLPGGAKTTLRQGMELKIP